MGREVFLTGGAIIEHQNATVALEESLVGSHEHKHSLTGGPAATVLGFVHSPTLRGRDHFRT